MKIKRFFAMLMMIVAGVVSILAYKDMTGVYKIPSIYSYKDDSGVIHSVMVDRWPVPLEHDIANASHIVVGSCTNVVSSDYAMLYEFSIESQLKGVTIENEKIYVRVSYDERQPNTEKNDKFYCNYMTGKRYLLILARFLHVYENDYYWEGFTNSVIPLFEPENMYINEEKNKLWAWSDMTLFDVINEKTFLNYVKKEIAKEPVPRKNYEGIPYIQSDDLETILQGSENVFRIKVGDKCGKDELNEEFNCEILEQYKGIADLTVQNRIELFCDQVSEGEEYIVALTECYDRRGSEGGTYPYYRLSSKNSIINVEKEEVVKNILVNGE